MSNYLIVSTHDIRSKRKANMHFIAEELASRGRLYWFSPGYSILTRLKRRDPRLGLKGGVNSVGPGDGVISFLWKTLLHPFKLGVVDPLTFSLYEKCTPKLLLEWASLSDYIFIESGLSTLFIKRLRRANVSAKMIYIASDDMKTIGNSTYLIDKFRSNARLLDGARLPTPKLIASIPVGTPAFYVPHGIDAALYSDRRASPYEENGKYKAVSVGSTLFDPDFFFEACRDCPEIEFHVIGAGIDANRLPPQVVYHPEMPFAQTLPYLQHATLGIAPYDSSKLPYYISGSSMKLLQYDYLGLPSVCPEVAVGQSSMRHGYVKGLEGSIAKALRSALTTIPRSEGHFLSWSAVVDRLLSPSEYHDTRI